jgi:hypothetical protein
MKKKSNNVACFKSLKSGDDAKLGLLPYGMEIKQELIVDDHAYLKLC